jgi:hypothetical protein
VKEVDREFKKIEINLTIISAELAFIAGMIFSYIIRY